MKLKHYIIFGILSFTLFALLGFFSDWVTHPENIEYIENVVAGLSASVIVVLSMKFYERILR